MVTHKERLDELEAAIAEVHEINFASWAVPDTIAKGQQTLTKQLAVMQQKMDDWMVAQSSHRAEK